ncbi:MAG: hypothetical protein QG577_58, partial [Thermodesulfobacteriota bacterium]|nr:hypothetical protein [Thermodesulfobacteriota bacterium]
QKSLEITTTNFAWAPWAEVGMATRGSVQDTLESMGIEFISPIQGAQMLVDELQDIDGQGGEVVVAGNLGPFDSEAFNIADHESKNDMKPRDVNWAGQRVVVDNVLPGEYLKARILLDPSHPLLNHHRIERACVLPGVGGLEFMQLAMSYLDPHGRKVSFKRVEFVSPLKLFRNESVEVEIELVRVADPSTTRAFQAQLTSWTRHTDGRKIGTPRLHHRARIVTGDDEPVVETQHATPGQFTFIADTDIYATFFHGPAFRFLDHALINSETEEVCFRYRSNSEADSMFSSPIPGAIESAFQACAAFGLEARRVMALPVSVHDVKVYSNNISPHGGRFKLVHVLEDVSTDRKIFQFDGYVSDSQGQPILALSGLKMISMQGDVSFPKRIFESIFSTKDLLKSVETSSESPQELDEAELAEYSSRVSEKRASEWISGRLALKRTVRRLLEESGNPPIPLRDIRIVKDQKGKPYAERSRMPGQTLCEVSLSHSNGLVMAAATQLGDFRGLGIDVEKVEDRSEPWTEDYFTDRERAASELCQEKSAYFTKVWCIKEAALKALGLGLRLDLRDIDVSALDESGRAVVEFRNGASEQVSEINKKMEARAEIREGIAIARVIIRE